MNDRIQSLIIMIVMVTSNIPHIIPIDRFRLAGYRYEHRSVAVYEQEETTIRIRRTKAPEAMQNQSGQSNRREGR